MAPAVFRDCGGRSSSSSWRPAPAWSGALPAGSRPQPAGEGGGPRNHGDGDHLLHGHGVGRPPEPRCDLGLRPPRRLPVARVPGYLVAQAAGAFLAAGFLAATFGGVVNGATCRAGHHQRPGLRHRARADARACQRHPRDRHRRPQHRLQRRARRGGYIGVVAVWGAPVRGVDEPAAVARTGSLPASMSGYWI